MADRPPRTTAEALVLAFEEIRRLKARLNQPRTRLLMQDWTITENADGDLIMRNKNGTTHVFPK